MKSFLRLLYYLSVGMIVIPIVLVVLAFVDYLDKAFHAPLGWAPALAVLTILSAVVFNYTEKKIHKGADDK